MSFRVVVIGGAGVFGRYIVEGLIASPTDFEVTVASRHRASFDRAYPAASDRLRFQAFDLDAAATVAPLLSGKQIVIVAAGPFQGFGPELALEASRLGVHYIDICDDPVYMQQLQGLQGELCQSGALVLSGLSSLPGLSVRLLDVIHTRLDVLEDVSIGLFIGNSNHKGRGAVTSAIAGLEETATVIEDGEPKEIPVWSHKESYPYPAPIGSVPSFSFRSPDPLLVPGLFDVRSLRVKVSFEWRLARWAFSLFKLASRVVGVGPVLFLSGRLYPLFNLFHRFGSERGCVSVVVKGKRDERPVTIRASLIGLEKGQRLASLPAVVAAEAIANREHRGAGLCDLVSWLPSQVFLDKLVEKGLLLRVEEVA